MPGPESSQQLTDTPCTHIAQSSAVSCKSGTDKIFSRIIIHSLYHTYETRSTLSETLEADVRKYRYWYFKKNKFVILANRHLYLA